MKIYTFKIDGQELYLGRVEVWGEEITLFSKAFLDEKSRDRWVRDKAKCFRLIHACNATT
jgi:hypothetical protein